MKMHKTDIVKTKWEKKQISRHALRKIVDEMTPKKSQTYNKTKAVTILFCQTEKTKQSEIQNQNQNVWISSDFSSKKLVLFLW